MAPLTHSQRAAFKKRMDGLRERLKRKHKAELKAALAKRDAKWRERVNNAKRLGVERRSALAERHRATKERKRVAFWEKKLENGHEWAADYL
jgi:hypothetical protein